MTIHLGDTSKLAASASSSPITPPYPGLYRAHAKRLLDIALVLAALPVVLPILLVAAVLVALDGGNPFFRQERIGMGGRVFGMIKLRTMVPDAERLLRGHLDRDPSARREWDTYQKLRNDPRVTWIGRHLRASSIDELPQLWNVLVGDMSMVGPRPMMVEQRNLYPGTAYYRLRPGITGPWQISDRNECGFVARERFDTVYDMNMSLRTDLAILLRTPAVVLRGTGV